MLPLFLLLTDIAFVLNVFRIFYRYSCYCYFVALILDLVILFFFSWCYYSHCWLYFVTIHIFLRYCESLIPWMCVLIARPLPRPAHARQPLDISLPTPVSDAGALVRCSAHYLSAPFRLCSCTFSYKLVSRTHTHIYIHDH